VTDEDSSSLADAFDARREMCSADCYAIIEELAGTQNWQTRLAAFDVTEADYAAWSDAERAARSQAILDRATSARKLGEANVGAELVQVGQRAGFAVYQRPSRSFMRSKRMPQAAACRNDGGSA